MSITVVAERARVARRDPLAPGLPKTRSGKIMRRILRKIASGEYEGLGDTSTLADPAVETQLIDDKKRFQRRRGVVYPTVLTDRISPAASRSIMTK